MTYAKTQTVYKSTPAQLERARQYRQKNPEKAKAAHKAWLEANPQYGKDQAWKDKQREYHRKWRAANRGRLREQSRKYAAANKESVRANQKKHQLTETYAATRLRLHLARKFKITVEQYNAMLEAQNGVCKICGFSCGAKRRGTRKMMSLSVDHDHSTGKVRGLLCNSCNVGLGRFKDNINSLERAVAYLKGQYGKH